MVPSTSRCLTALPQTLLLIAAPVFAQAPAAPGPERPPIRYAVTPTQRPPAPPAAALPALVSPEVHPDLRVTFRFRAPNAKEVKVGGDFVVAQPMIRDAEGVWTLTTGPFHPDIYSYTFTVDGISLTDPSNPRLKTGVRSSQSVLRVAGDGNAVWDEKPVPRGVLHIHSYRSKTLGDSRRFYVYTPPGYDSDPRARFPVLYLLHGAGDDESGWTSVGRADVILDNLFAGKQTRPMVVVMPFGHAVPFTAPRGGPGWLNENTRKFESDLLNDVMPEAESRYRVHRDARNRAIAGLSMGGGQALMIGLSHLDQFGWVGGFSSAVFADSLKDSFKSLLADPESARGRLKLLWIACGRDDRLLAGSEALAALLKENKVEHELRVTPGAHTWRVWRRYLADFAPLLFKP